MVALNKRLNTSTTKPYISRRTLYIKANLLGAVVDGAPSNYHYHFVFRNIKKSIFFIFRHINMCYFFIF